MAAALFAVASASDFYDGFLARRWGVASTSAHCSTRSPTSCS